MALQTIAEQQQLASALWDLWAAGSHAALSMGGCVKVRIAANNEPCIHISALDVACRDSKQNSKSCTQAVKMIDTCGTGLIKMKLAGRWDELYFENIKF